MDTITEAAASEAEEMSHDGDSRSPAEKQAAPPGHKASQPPHNQTNEVPEASKMIEEPLSAETETEASEEDIEGGRAATSPSSEVTVQGTHTPPRQIEPESCSVHGNVESVTTHEHYNRAFTAEELEEQPIQV